ncbi:MAG: AMP-binding protein [Gammaproteobacteria bacterium]|nr:AMP-binding protein [Gammaproteobacteria bacterium]MCP5200787.1 AMP-binding protein [Gammaproteobacteria bacterium]
MAEWYPKRSFGQLVDEVCERFGPREALVFGEERYTFDEVAARIDEVARGLIELGVKPGDHVALWLMNRPEWIFTMFALARIGAVQVPVNTRFRTHDLAYLLKQSDARYLITHDVSGPVDFLAMVREVVELPVQGVAVHDPGFPELERVIVLGERGHAGCVSFDDMLDEAAEVDAQVSAARAAMVDPDHPVFIMYTSGTTGFPKGVMHNHVMLRLVEERAFRLAITENDTILNYLPLFHLFSYSEAALMSMLTGARQVLTETFEPAACIRLIERERVTVMHGFETHLKDLSDAQERLGADLSSLRCGLFAAGMQSGVPITRRAAEVLAPLVTVTGYGMSEMGAGTIVGSLGDSLEQRAETSGYPAPGYRFRIVDPASGAEQPVGTPGEITCKGYGLMMGYYEKPAETAACYDDDGWFHTGDMGVLRADGYIRFLGRYKDMLKVGGENVDPMEVEGLLLGLDGVQQVAVVGFPDERLSEVPVAFVQPTDDSTLTEKAVLDYCRGKVATFKIPRHVLFVDALPMTSSGKIRKVELREQAQSRLQDAGTD